MPARRLHATINSVTRLYSGFLKMNRYLLTIERHDGSRHTREWELMERDDTVAVLAYDPATDEVVLGNEIRPGALVAGDYPYLEQLIAGGIGADESVLDAAVRETREETGLDLADPVIVHAGAYVSSGGTTEKVAIVFGIVDATRAGGVHGSPGESEDILTVVRPAEEFIRAVKRGEVDDLKTLVAGYWLADYRAERFSRP